MKIAKNKLKRIIREEYNRVKLIKESVHSQLDGELTNLVFLAAQEVNERYTEITVQDVVDEINRMDEEGIINYDYEFASPNHHDYFVSAAKEMTYEDVADRMHQLIDLGELTGGYEDFFEMGNQ